MRSGHDRRFLNGMTYSLYRGEHEENHLDRHDQLCVNIESCKYAREQPPLSC